MMEDFQLFNPGVVTDPVAEKVSKLKTRNIYLAVSLVLTISLTVYYAYMYYTRKEENLKVK